jgi:RNA polymerase sigma-70 factor, ECF subfamily
MIDGPDAILSDLQQARQRFLVLVAEVRPELHRYCARMTGSIADGEDVVQDTLARAYYELSEVKEVPPLRPWLFRIAHNRAVDYLRRYERRMSEPLDAAMELAADAALEPDHALARQDAVRTAVSRFLELPPAQRSCVILKDVLEHSLEEIATMLELSIPAIKAALHRGRARLRELSRAGEQTSMRASSPAIVRYAELFNGRDWDGVRAMLADDVKLDLVTRWKVAGRRQVGTVYVTNYGASSDWHLVPGWLDGREVLAVFRDRRDARPAYFIKLTVVEGRVAAIQDFRYVPYIGHEAAIELRDPPG